VIKVPAQVAKVKNTVGAGALVTGLAVFAFATKKDPSMKVSRKDFGSKKL